MCRFCLCYDYVVFVVKLCFCCYLLAQLSFQMCDTYFAHLSRSFDILRWQYGLMIVVACISIFSCIKFGLYWNGYCLCVDKSILVT